MRAFRKMIYIMVNFRLDPKGFKPSKDPHMARILSNEDGFKEGLAERVTKLMLKRERLS